MRALILVALLTLTFMASPVMASATAPTGDSDAQARCPPNLPRPAAAACATVSALADCLRSARNPLRCL